MGAIGDAMLAYVEPLLDESDGSRESIESAFAVGQICWNLAMAPQDVLPELLEEMQQSLKMDDAAFYSFSSDIIIPMIARHHEMFPHMHKGSGIDAFEPEVPWGREASGPVTTAIYGGTPRNAPCPCNSGKKYKRCCGQVH